MISKIFLLLFASVIVLYSFATPPNEKGKTLFTSRCAACHNTNKLIVGPALAGIDNRRSIDWIIKFVQSSQTLVKSGDKDAAALFTKFNIVMPDHQDLKAEDVKDIVDYIKSETVASTNTEEQPFSRP